MKETKLTTIRHLSIAVTLVVALIAPYFLYAQDTKTSTSKDAKSSSNSPTSTKTAEANGSTSTGDAEDDDEDEVDTKWLARAKASITSRRTKQGADVSKDKSSFGTSFGLSYDPSEKIGFAVGAGTNNTLRETPSFQGWWWNVGVTYTPIDWLSIAVGYNRDIYSGDPDNIFGDLTNTFTGSIDTDFDLYGFSASFTVLPGDQTTTARYFGVGAFMHFSIGKFTISPALDVSLVSQQVKNERIAKLLELTNNPNPKLNKKLYTQVEGLSSVNFAVNMQYKIFDGFKVSFSPSFLYTPKTDIYSVRSAQIILTAGIQYAFSF